MLNKDQLSIDYVIARVNNDFNFDNGDYAGRIATWCIDCMNEMGVFLEYRISDKVRCTNGTSTLSKIITRKNLQVFDTNGNEYYYVKTIDKNRELPVRYYTLYKEGYSNVINVTPPVEEILLTYDTLEMLTSNIYDIEVPAIPNNGKLLECLVFYCVYKILARGIKHPVYSLNNPLPTNPYLLYMQTRPSAKASCIINKQKEDVYSGLNNFMYDSTFNPRKK